MTPDDKSHDKLFELLSLCISKLGLILQKFIAHHKTMDENAIDDMMLDIQNIKNLACNLHSSTPDSRQKVYAI